MKTKQEQPDAIFNKYMHLRVTENSKSVASTPIVSIGEHAIITESNISAISGQPKEGKSSFAYYILSQAILPNFGITNNDIWEEITVARNIDNKAIIHIDTEQALHNHVNAYKNSIWKRSGIDKPPDYFQSYNLRGLEIDECKVIIHDIVLACKQKFNGINLIVIDGIADLLKSVNDEEESNRLIRFLERISRFHKCAIIVVIHTNPGTSKQRGHIGSQLQRKAETILNVKKEGNVSYIEPQFLRNASNSDIPRVQFAFNKIKGYHVFAGTKDINSLSEEKEGNIKEIARQVFKEDAIAYNEAIALITKMTGRSASTANSNLKKMVSAGYVQKSSAGYTLNLND